jgi:5-methyltetrahydrofolate--homocysteine methyltransferase
VNELHRRKLNFPVLIGGAAINPRFGWRIFKCEDGEYYAPGVFYCKDAFEGLAVMDTLTDAQRYQASLDDLRRKAEHEYAAAQARPEKSVKPGVARPVPPAEKVPEVKQWGRGVVVRDAVAVVWQAPEPERALPPLVGREKRARQRVETPAGRIRFTPRSDAAQR